VALPENLRRKIEAEAKRRGVDPADALQEAERLAADEAPSAPAEAAPDAPTRPVADRLLIGFLPFIKVRELRQHWLGLDERIADDDMTCGEYQLKHGGAGAPAEPKDGE
jgi:hypothetical protein